mmetsp:Transcript_88394/g.249070  ORF Transcript_88394/g.249070 Transcript_88394/m.249070 type:complete len:200 (+) Transcript_88394:989-1588(+)
MRKGQRANDSIVARGVRDHDVAGHLVQEQRRAAPRGAPLARMDGRVEANNVHPGPGVQRLRHEPQRVLPASATRARTYRGTVQNSVCLDMKPLHALQELHNVWPSACASARTDGQAVADRVAMYVVPGRLAQELDRPTPLPSIPARSRRRVESPCVELGAPGQASMQNPQRLSPSARSARGTNLPREVHDVASHVAELV